MTFLTLCDYCGAPIEDEHPITTLRACTESYAGAKRDVDLGHYHEGGELECYQRLCEALELVREWGKALAGHATLPGDEEAPLAAKGLDLWQMLQDGSRSARDAYGALFGAGIRTVDQLCLKSREDLFAISGMGEYRVDAVEDLLAAHGLELRKHEGSRKAPPRRKKANARRAS
jgi:hypothetical protein